MTKVFLTWCKELQDKITALKRDISSLFYASGRDVINIEMEIKVKKLFIFNYYKNIPIELKSDFSFKALQRLYEDELKRLQDIFDKANEDNYFLFKV